jgi:CRP-like cAMP-binding protein
MPYTAAEPSIDKVAALRRTELFSGLPESVLSDAAGCAIVRRFKAGEILYSESDKASALHVIVDGEIRSVRLTAKGREQVLSTEGAGAVLAAAPVFNGKKFHTTAIAEKPGHVLCIPSADVHRLCREQPDLLWAISTVFSHRVRQYAELIETLALRNVDQRLAQFLLAACMANRTATSDTCTIHLELGNTEIAGCIGSTHEVVSSALRHLETQGLIQMQGQNTLNIPSTQALSKFAGTHGEPEDISGVAELPSDIA